MTQLLDFFESGPLLDTVTLSNITLGPSDAPLERILPLRRLKSFHTNTDPPHLIPMRHLHIPTGVSMTSHFYFNGLESPVIEYLPERSPNFDHLSQITTVNLLLSSKSKYIRLNGPSKILCISRVSILPLVIQLLPMRLP